MRIQTLFAAVVICVMAGALQARSLSHKVGEPVAINPKDPDFLVVDAFVHAERPELKLARAVAVKLAQGVNNTYTILYSDLTNFYNVTAVDNRAQTNKKIWITSFTIRPRP